MDPCTSNPSPTATLPELLPAAKSDSRCLQLELAHSRFSSLRSPRTHRCLRVRGSAFEVTNCNLKQLALLHFATSFDCDKDFHPLARPWQRYRGAPAEIPSPPRRPPADPATRGGSARGRP